MFRTRSLRAALGLAVVLALGATACSDDDTASDAAEPTASTTADGIIEEDGVEVVEEVDDTYLISQDDRIDAFVTTAQEHFGDRYAGLSFHRDVDDDDQPVGPETITIHLVDATDADATWLQDQAVAVDEQWGSLVSVSNAALSTADLTEALRTVMERLGETGVEHGVEVDMANNRIVVNAPDLDAGQRDTIRQGLPEGSVVFADELVDEDEPAD